MTVAKALEIWTAQSLCDIGILLSVVSFMFHAGRPYFERLLGRMTLRVAADLWWLAYVVLRDGTLLAAFICGLFWLNLDLMADIKVGLPFCPLATVVLGAALALKVFRNTEDPGRDFFRCSALVAAGALLNSLGFVFVMEAPGGEYPAAETAFWKTVVSWRSNANPVLATYTFYITAALLAALAVWVCVMAVRAYRQTGKDGHEPL